MCGGARCLQVSGDGGVLANGFPICMDLNVLYGDDLFKGSVRREWYQMVKFARATFSVALVVSSLAVACITDSLRIMG